MKQIKLSQGYFATVDDEDFERINAFKWHVIIIHDKTKDRRYAQRSFRVNGITKTELMHVEIMGKIKGFDIDHANCDGLINTRGNLRRCTRSQNKWNISVITTKTSKYKGVYFNKRDGAYQSTITINKKRICLCFTKNEEEAAMAYDKAAKKFHGEYAQLNFPQSG